MIAPTFAGIAGVLLVALWPTQDERRRWRARRCAMPSARSRALLPGGALVAPFTIGREPMEGRCSLSDTATAHEGDARR